MVRYSEILEAMLPVFCLLGIGFVLRKINVLTTEADSSLMKLVIYLFYPSLIFSNILGNPALNNWKNLALPPLIGFCMIMLGFGFAYWLAPWLGLKRSSQRRSFTMTAGINNYGYIPIPLIAVLFDSREILGVLLIHNVGVEIAFFAIGIMIVSGMPLKQSWKKAINPVLISLIVSLIMNGTGTDAFVPTAALLVIDMLAECAIPVGLILTGAILSEFLQNANWLSGWRTPLGASAIRFLLIPCILLVAIQWIPASPELKKVVVIQAAMPCGIFPIVICKHYGADVNTSIQSVIGTSLIGFFLIPLWIRFGLEWVS